MSKLVWSAIRALFLCCAAGAILAALSACEAPVPTQTPTGVPSATETEQIFTILPTATHQTPSPTPSQTVTPGPSPTSTPFPDLPPQSWQAKPIMVEAARMDTDALTPFYYTPLFLLYGDGMLVQRSCQNGECAYLQSQLDQPKLCRLINAIDRTGFLNVDPFAFDLPGGTGAVIRLAVDIDTQNEAQIPDLDRWAENITWYDAYTGCPGCFAPPIIDPAFIDLYRLLTTYEDAEPTGLNTDRLAVWLAKPIIAGPAQAWSPDLTPLSELADLGTCPEDSNRQSAIIFEGSSARVLTSFLSEQSGSIPLFIEEGITWQVHSRWLLPYEMPQTCENDAGLYPPAGEIEITWSCSPEDGAIPTSTATITHTPSNTPTPLR